MEETRKLIQDLKKLGGVETIIVKIHTPPALKGMSVSGGEN